MDDLRDRTLVGLSWNLLEQVGNQVISFVPTIVLARLLAPEQFGLIGMLSLFIAVANAFLDSGFGVALIQKRDATHLDECSIFYFNILVGGISVLVLFFSAPLIAAFFQQPILVGLTRWMSLDILINSFELIQTTLLTRAIDFKTQIKANLFATLFAGIFGVAAAYFGLGVWSLVIQTLSGSILRTLTLWRLSAWRPALVFSLASLRGMFGFGSRMLLSGLIAVFFDNLYQMFIGKVFSAASLGYYTRAASLRGVVIDTTSSAIGRVMFPALASIQDDPERLKRSYRKSAVLSAFVHFPIMIGLIVVARPLIALLFSTKWDDCVVFFQLMCAAGLLYPLQIINLNILKVRGRSDLFLNLQVIRRILIIANILIAYRWGISAILLGQVVISGIAYLLNSFYSERLIAYPIKAQILDVLPSFLLAGLMGGGMLLVGIAIGPTNDFLRLVAQVGIGVILYLALNWFRKSGPLYEVVGIVWGWAARLLKRSLPLTVKSRLFK
ncbi:MAG: lipopolysaccharide biosynthesis protein [Chloroflexi bacterium]|nr:lipopolysaccharide biosynthesis protein [Chloroflexota bacterium]